MCVPKERVADDVGSETTEIEIVDNFGKHINSCNVQIAGQLYYALLHCSVLQRTVMYCIVLY